MAPIPTPPTRPKSETLSTTPDKPASPRKRQKTEDLLEARRKAKTVAGDEGKPIRKKAKTIDLRELKSQLSSSNQDDAVGDKQLGQTVAKTILGVESATDASNDLTDQISKLTASIDEFVNENEGDGEKS